MLVTCEQVRKLWCDYSEAINSNSNRGTATETAGNGVGDEVPIPEITDASISTSTINSSDSTSISATHTSSASGLTVGGQGPARALRAFVDAVDLSDAKQAAVLQNLVRSSIMTQYLY